MKKIILLLSFLTLTASPALYAQNTNPYKTYPVETSPSLSNNAAEASKPYDELGTQLTIYSLIIGVYAFYWLRQKA